MTTAVTSLMIALVRAYRSALAPFFGPACRFEPSCSHYAEEALALHGPWHGSVLTLRRLARCQPFAAPGLDPVPGAAASARARG